MFLMLFLLSFAFGKIPDPGTGVVYLYFETSFAESDTFIHFRVEPGEVWSDTLMEPSTSKDFPNWTQFSVESKGLEFLFHNQAGEWVHTKSGGNFDVSGCGIFSVDKDLDVKTIKVYPEGKCLNNCSGHGTCDVDTGTCTCEGLYYGTDCSSKCNSGEIVCYDQYCYKGKECPLQPLPGCQIFTDGKCDGDVITQPSDFSKRRWQTPVRGSRGWISSYQDYAYIQGWSHVEYDSSHKSALVDFRTIVKYDNPSLIYVFDGKEQTSSNKTFDSSFTSTLTLEVYDKVKGYKISIQDIDFIWNVEPLKSREGDYRNGQKGALVEFFGWPDEDVMKECEVLSKAGYLGARIFPHHEQLMSVQPFNNDLNPWYFMYQPVSYSFEGRMGSRDDLKKLISTCRKLGVRVYHDSVVNHMTGSGNDAQNHRNSNGGTCTYWPMKNTSNSMNPSPYYTQGFCYEYNENTELPPQQEYPGVPYGPLDFHCERPLNSWDDPLQLNAGWLTGLVDLNTERDHVRERIADYFVDQLGIGFSGFRIDAFKHVKPDDWVAIISKFKRNLGNTLPDDFFFWGEVLIGGEHEMLLCNEESGYNYGPYLTKQFLAAGITEEELLKLKLWSSWYPKETDADCDEVDRRREVIQNDDQDQQNSGSSSRDMGDKGTVLVIAKDIPLHRKFETILFQDPFNVKDNDNEWPIRNVLSSYWFSAPSGSTAIPDGKSDCSLCQLNCDSCNSVPYIPAYNATACAYDGSGGNNSGYTLVHRDRTIILAMREWMHLSTDVTNEEIGIPDRCQ